MNEKKKLPAWLVPAIVIAILAVIGFVVYRKVYDLMFGGSAHEPDFNGDIQGSYLP